MSDKKQDVNAVKLSLTWKIRIIFIPRFLRISGTDGLRCFSSGYVGM